MSNVRTMPGLRDRGEPGKPCEELIATMRDVLSRAESGELQSFIGTGFQVDGGRLAAWADTHENYYEMLGALMALQDEYRGRHSS